MRQKNLSGVQIYSVVKKVYIENVFFIVFTNNVLFLYKYCHIIIMSNVIYIYIYI